MHGLRKHGGLLLRQWLVVAGHTGKVGTQAAQWIAMLAISGTLVSAGAQTRAHFEGVRTTVGSLPTAPLENPLYVAVDLSGNVYVGASGDTSYLRKFTPGASGTYTTPTTAFATTGNGLNGLAVDAAGNIYLAETDPSSNTTLTKFAPDGSSVLVPVPGISTSDYVNGIAVDAAGDVYLLVDSSTARVVKETFSAGSYMESTVLSGLSSTSASIAVDTLGNLYITSTSGVIKETRSGGTFTPSSLLFASTGTSDSIAVDLAGNIYLGDASNTSGSVFKETLNGGTYTESTIVLGIDGPAGVAVDQNGNVFVTEVNGSDTYRISPAAMNFGSQNVGSTSAPTTITFFFDTGGMVGTPAVVTQGTTGLDFAGTGTCFTNGTSHVYSANDTCTVNVTFAPTAPGTRVGAVVLKDNLANALATASLYGTGVGPQLGFDAGKITSITPSFPGSIVQLYDVTPDSVGNLYFTDNLTCIIEEYVLSTHTLGVLSGQSTGSGHCAETGDGGLAINAKFQGPSHIAIDGQGDLFISDIASSLIRKIDASSNIISVVAGIAGQSAYGTDGAVATQTAINAPTALILDPAGNIYFAESQKLVRRIDAVTGVLSTVAGNVSLAAGYGGDGQAATSAQLNTPASLALNAAGDLFIGDSQNNVVRKVSASSGLITTFAGHYPNTCTFAGDSLAANAADLCDPVGVVTDAAGNLYIGDAGNEVTRKVNGTSNLITTAAGIYNNHSGGYTGDGGSAKLAQLGFQAEITRDANDNLYLIDQDLSLIRKVAMSNGVASFGSFAVGSSSPAIDVTVTNNGNAALNLSGLVASTNFNLNGAHTTCSSSTVLAPAASCILGIEFLPTVGGPLTGTVTVTDNVNNVLGLTQTVTLSGTGMSLPATHLGITGVPSFVYAGGNLGTVTATLLDTNGNTATGTAGSVTLTITGPGGYSQTLTVTAVNGIASFNLASLPLSTVGAYTLSATSTGLTSATATTNVYLPATQTALSTVSSPILTGGNLGAVTVSLKDANGQVVTTSSALVVLTVTGPFGYTQTGTANATAGVASFDLTTFSLTTVGLYTVTATSTGLTNATATTQVNALVSATALSTSTNAAAQGSPVTLTATTTIGANPANPGQVTFNYTQVSNGVTLTGSFGTGSLTSAGTSVLTIRPGAGTYTITAAFAGTRTVLTSTSAAQTLTVTGTTPSPTVSGITSTGTPGNYTLTATVGQLGLLAPPTGFVSFLDTSAANQNLATATLDPTTVTYGATAAPSSPLASPNAASVTMGDLNNDGIADLVTADTTTGISVQLGLGNGAFGAATSYAVGGNCTVKIADVNNDGSSDLVVGCSAGQVIYIMLGNGTGTFSVPATGPQNFYVPYPIDTTVVDFDGDGNLDLVCADYFRNVEVMRGNGDGTFRSAALYPTGGYFSIGLAIADLNHDGALDVVVTDFSAVLYTLLGKGDGTLLPVSSRAISSGLAVPSLGSLRGNGVIDLLVPKPGGISVFLGNDDGTFAASPMVYPVGYAPDGLGQLADLNRDGKLDYVVNAGGANPLGQVTVAFGKGDGTFGAIKQFTSSSAVPAWFTLGDVNNDGQIDIVIANANATPANSTVGILLGELTATATATGVIIPGPIAQLVDASYAGDAQNAASVSSTISLLPPVTTTAVSGSPNLALAGAPVVITATISSSLFSPASGGTVTFFQGSTQVAVVNVVNGTATYTTTGLTAGLNTFYGVYSGSVLLGGSTSPVAPVYVVPQSATSLTSSPTSALDTVPITLTAVTTAIPSNTLVSPGQVVFLYTRVLDGVTLQGSFGSAQLTSLGTASLTITPGPGTFTVTAQFSGTTSAAASLSAPQTIVVTAAATNYLTETTLSATGTPGNYSLTGTVGSFGLLSATGSVNFVDTSLGSTILGTAALSSSPIGYSLVAASPAIPNPNIYSVQLADLNGDGLPDLVSIANTYGNAGTVRVQFGNGDGTFGTATSYNSGGAFLCALAISDVNGDGHPDILVTSQSYLNPGGPGELVLVLLNSGTGTFQTPTGSQILPASVAPSSIAVTDLNLDGKSDLIVTNLYEDKVSVFLGNGDGTFQNQVKYPFAGTSAYSTAIGDFTGDGYPDIAVIASGDNTFPGSVSILRGVGDGTFSALGNMTAPTNFSAYAGVTGSLRGNNILDLVVANAAGPGILVYLGNGDGTFSTAPTTVTTLDVTYALLLTDFNHDGKLDILAANSPSGVPGHIGVFLGNGDGTFGPEQAFAAGSVPYSISTADLNHDGLTDVVTSNYSDGTSTVLLGVRTVTATATGISVPGPGSQAVDAIYSGDSLHTASVSSTLQLLPVITTTTLGATPASALIGTPVVLTASVSSTLGAVVNIGTVSFYSGSTLLATQPVVNGVAAYASSSFAPGYLGVYAIYSGTATLGTSTSPSIIVFVGPQSAISLALSSNAASLGTPIVLTATGVTSPGGTVLTRGQVSFTYQQTLNGVTVSGSFGTAQMTSSGIATLSVAPAAGVYVLTAAYAGTDLVAPSLSTPQTITVTGSYATSTALTATGGAGNYTLLSTVSSFGAQAPSGFVSFSDTTTPANPVAPTTAAIVPGSLTSSFTPASGSPVAVAGTTWVATADLNHDGVPDLVNATPANVLVQLGIGDGTFGTATAYAVPDGIQVVFGDFNGDGKLDIASLNAISAQITILLGNGDGTFQVQTPAVNVGSNYPNGTPGYIAVADLNHDGRLDLVTVNSNSDEVSIFLGLGDGTFPTQQELATGQNPIGVAITDLNRDGILDLAVTNANSSNVTLLLGDGTGVFTPATPLALPMGAYPGIPAAGSLRNNGINDLLVPNQNCGCIYVYLGNPDGSFPAQPVTYTNSYYGVSQVVLDDYNHDGKLDVVVSAFEQASVYSGNGDGTLNAETDISLGTGNFNVVNVAVADLNHDGLSDIAASVQTHNTDVIVLNRQTETAIATGAYVTGVGPQNVVATFAATANLAASVSPAVPLQPSVQAASGTTLTASATSILLGGSVTFTVTVAPPPTGAHFGTVSFTSNGSLLTTIPVPASGVVNYTTSSLLAGVNAIVATYSGNAGSATSTAPAVNVTVQLPTATALTGSGTAGMYGQALVLTATVTPAPNGVTLGTVSFLSGTVVLGTGTPNAAGVAVLTLNTVNLGANSITASYSGTNLYTASSSSAINYAVIIASTSTSLNVTNQPPTNGQPVLLTATITPGPVDTLAGTVTFFSGTTLLGTASVVNGTAAISLTYLPVGLDVLTAVYSGTTHYTASTSPSVSLMGGLPTTTTLATSSLSPMYAQSFVLTATTTPPSTDTIRGTVTFYAGAVSLGTAQLSTSGTASLTVNGLGVGAKSITATYSGSASFAGSTSGVLALGVVQASTANTLSSSNLAPTFGQPVTLTATLVPPSTDAQRGIVSFYSGTVLLGTAPLDANGLATLSTAALTQGPNALHATYTGSIDFAGSTSPSLAVSARAVSAISFGATPTTQLYNNPIVFSAQVTSPTTGAPGGTVSFFEGTSLVGSAPVGAGGRATQTITTLGDGTHTVTAMYSGDPQFLPSTFTGTPIAITVGDLNLALGGDKNKTIVPGEAVVYNLPLSPLVTPTFIYDVTLTASGLPPGATYTFLPNVIPAGSGTLPVVFTVQTSASAAANSGLPGRRGTAPWSAVALGLLLPVFTLKRTRAALRRLPRSLALLLFALLSFGIAAGVSGCGTGGFYGSNLSGKSFTITVNANSAALLRTSTVQLNFK